MFVKHNIMISQACKNHIIAQKIKLLCVTYRVNIKGESTVQQGTNLMFIFSDSVKLSGECLTSYFFGCEAEL